MKSISSNIILKLALLLFAVLCVVTVVRLQLKNNSLKQETVATNQEGDVVEAGNDEKKEMIDKDFDLEYVIEIAREKLHLSLPGEIIFYNDN
ncbi:MAG: septum formation initiator family protein [Clostridia bacterium]|nr:septum formation initiator family protein [Clostridia bacterium]